jgi:hypothetical protein
MSLGELINLYRDDELKIDPVFQRLFRWDEERKTRFIESILLGIPFPPIFVFQNDDGVWELIDGLQRLSTLFQLTGDLKGERAQELGVLVLNGTRFLPSLDGKRWTESAEGAGDGIGQVLQIEVKRARVRVEILKSESDLAAKFELFQRLDEEMSWRIKEISDFRLVTKQAVNSATFVRVGVALLYARWEGFIKAASVDYLNFVDNQGHIYKDLKTCFAVFGLKGRLATLRTSQKAKSNIEALDFVFSEMDRPAKMSMSSAIDTESNLTSKVFSNIAISLDIAISPYETKFNLIDESLVNRRNKVAHGEYVDLAREDFFILANEILQMMRDFKTDIQNAASQQSYKRTGIVAGHDAAIPA